MFLWRIIVQLELFNIGVDISWSLRLAGGCNSSLHLFGIFRRDPRTAETLSCKYRKMDISNHLEIEPYMNAIEKKFMKGILTSLSAVWMQTTYFARSCTIIHYPLVMWFSTLGVSASVRRQGCSAGIYYLLVQFR